jgi:hypothetical protein
MVNKSSSSEIAKTGYLDEDRLRQLAVELARDIHEPNAILKHLGLSEDDYNVIKDTRAFKNMYNLALGEWNAASNTPKRVKLKAAAMTEEVLPMFYADIAERKESLTARVSLLQTLSKIGGLGNPEPLPPGGGNHQFFKLEIHLQGRKDPIVIDGQPLTASSDTFGDTLGYGIPMEAVDDQEGQEASEAIGERLNESTLAADEPFDEF